MEVILKTLKCCVSRSKNYDEEEEIEIANEKEKLKKNELLYTQKNDLKLETYEQNIIFNKTPINQPQIIKTEEEKICQSSIQDPSSAEKIASTDEIIVNEKLIRRDEKDIITFSKNGVINFIKSFEDANLVPWTPLYEKNNLILHYRKGSPLNSEFLVGKCKYTINKSLFKQIITLDNLIQHLLNPEKRMSWDKNFKEFKILENGENYAVFKIWMFSPIFFISERDIIDKRIEFYDKGVHYYLASSVDDYSEITPNVVRCLTYLNCSIISEDEENFNYYSLTQIDAKTIIPEKILNITIPIKTHEFFNNLVKAINNSISD